MSSHRPAFIDHDLDYLRRYPRAAQISPLGPRPLRVRLVINTLVRKWIDRVAGLPAYSGGPRAQRQVMKLAIIAGLPVLEAQAAKLTAGGAR